MTKTKPTGKKPRPTARRAAPLHLDTLGQVVEVVYQHIDGKVRRHKFGAGVLLGSVRATGGRSKTLVITGAHVFPYINSD